MEHKRLKPTNSYNLVQECISYPTLKESSTTPYQLNQNKLRFIRLGIHTSGVEEQNPGLRSVDDDDLVVEASHCGQNRVRR